MRHCRFGVWAAVCAALVMLAVGAEAADVGASTVSVTETSVRGQSKTRGPEGHDPVLLAELLARPSAYLDRKVRFDVYYAGQGEFYRPFYTQFIQGDYTNFAAWPLGTRLWVPEERGKAVPCFYVSRQRKEEQTRLDSFDPYSRISVFGRVVSAHGGLPWVEVYAVRLVEEKRYTEQKLRRLEFAMRRSRAREYTHATEAIRAVLTDGLPVEGTALVHVDLGRSYYENGEYEAAASALEVAESLRPEDAELKLLLARARLRGGAYEKAIASVKKVLAIDPHNPDAYAVMGLALGELGHREEGLAACERALRLAPTHAWALRNSGYILAAGGQVDKAIVAYYKAIQALTMEPTFHEELGHLHVRVGKAQRKPEHFDHALKRFQNVSTLLPDSPLGYRLQGEVLHQLKKDDKAAEEKLVEAYRRGPKDFDTVLAFGRFCAATCGDDAAKRTRGEELLKLATELAPEDPALLWEYAGVVYSDAVNRRQKMPLLVEAYERLVKLTPGEAKAWMNLGLARWELAKPDLDGAAEAFTKARETGPDFPEAWLHSGRLAAERQQYGVAKGFLVRARDLKPENLKTRFRVHITLGHEALPNLGEIQASCQELEAAYEASKVLPAGDEDRDSTVAKNALAYFLTELGEGELPRAVALAREVVKEKPGSLAYLDTLGWALFRAGEVDAAFPHLLKAAEANPSVECYYHLAEAHLARGELTEAHAAALRAVKEYEEQEVGRASRWLEVNAQRAKELEARVAGIIAQRRAEARRREDARRTDLPDAPEPGTPIEERAPEKPGRDAPLPGE